MAHPEAIAHYPEGFQIAIKTIHNRIESGKNALIPVVGQTGAGKSLMVLQFMRGLHLYRYGVEPSDEEIIEHVVFKAKDFMEKMNNPNLKKKEVWNWDEAGIDVGHKDHASIKNRIIGWLTQTFRNLQQIVFFTVPSISFLDATVRKMLHYYIEAVAIDKRKKICVAKPLEMQYNVRMDKIYYHNLTSTNSRGELIEVDLIGVPKISDELEKKYEAIKSSFTIELNLRIQGMLQKIEDKEKKEGDNDAIGDGSNLYKLNDRQKEIYDLLQGGMTTASEIAKEMGLTNSQINKNFGYMSRKGVNIDIFVKKIVKNDIKNLKPRQPS